MPGMSAFWEGYNNSQSAFDRFMTGMEQGQRMADARRTRKAMDEAAGLMSARDYEGAARALYGAGKFNEGLAITRYGQDYADRETKLKTGQAFAADLKDDPDGPAAVAASGGDVDAAMKLLDWRRKATKEERELARQMADDFAAIVTPIAGRRYEERKPLIMAQSELLQRFGYTPEQLEAFDPTDDNIRAQQSAALGLQKVLGDYSQREVGDDLVTYNETPFGVRRMGSEPIPETRREKEAKRHNRVMEGFGQQRVETASENAFRINSTGDVMGPIYAKISRGDQLTPGEQKLYDDSRRAQDPFAAMLGGGDFTDPVPAGARLPPEPASAPNAFAARPPAAPSLPPRAPSAPGMTARPAPPPGGSVATPPTRPPAARPAPSAPRRTVGTAANPARPRNDAEFERLPVGAYFVNPADGRVLQKAQ